MFDALQLIGGLILAVGYIPQIIQLIRTKSCTDLNLKTYATVFIGIALMEAYAINLVANGTGLMFLVTNSMALLINGLLCGLIIKFKRSTTMTQTTMANLRSLQEHGDPRNGDFGHHMAEVTVISHTDNNNVIAEYQGVRYRAIFNPFAGQYFVDDVDGKIEEVTTQ